LEHFKEYSPDALKKEILRFSDYHSLCLTGGEPLLQADFLKCFLEGFSDVKKKIFLETNGTLVSELLKILDLVDIIAMDFKLPSTTSCGSFWKEHEEFLKASSGKDVFVKIVAGQKTERQDMTRAAGIIKRIKPDVAVVLQPLWGEESGALLDQMGSYKQEFLNAGISKVSLLPQMHKGAGIK
jgi:organic radical activating enzyme